MTDCAGLNAGNYSFYYLFLFTLFIHYMLYVLLCIIVVGVIIIVVGVKVRLKDNSVRAASYVSELAAMALATRSSNKLRHPLSKTTPADGGENCR